jgi:hypothetical protein
VEQTDPEDSTTDARERPEREETLTPPATGHHVTNRAGKRIVIAGIVLVSAGIGVATALITHADGASRSAAVVTGITVFLIATAALVALAKLALD